VAKGQFTANNQPKKRGRPRGAVNKTTAIVNQLRPELVQLAFANAMNPDHEHALGWANICCKLCPPSRTTLPTYTIKSNGDAKQDAKLITQAMNDGEISADVAQSALAACRDSVTLLEIESLEETLNRILAERGIA